MQDEKENLLKFNWMCRTASVTPLLHLLPLFSLYELGLFFYHLPLAISSCLFLLPVPLPGTRCISLSLSSLSLTASHLCVFRSSRLLSPLYVVIISFLSPLSYPLFLFSFRS